MNVLRAAILLLCAGAALPPAGAATAERTISVNLRNADVRQVVAYILRGTEVNYAFADDVDGRITCGLYDVPIERALQAILSVVGCEAAEDDGALIIRRRVPPPQPEPAAVTAKTPEKPQAPAEEAKAVRPEETPQREAAPQGAASAPSVTYVLVPFQAQPAGYATPQAAYPQAEYAPAHPHLSVANQWLQGYGGLPMGGGYGAFGHGAGTYRADAAWMQQAAAAAMRGPLGGLSPFGGF